MAEKRKKKSSAKSKKPVASKAATLAKKIDYNWFPKGFWRQHLWAALILLILPFALYLRTTSYTFVLDDKIVYTDNAYVKKGLAGIGDIFSKESFQGYFGEQKDLVEGGRYRPLSIATFAIEQHFFGNNSYQVGDYWFKQIENHPDFKPSYNRMKNNGNLVEWVYDSPDELLAELEKNLGADKVAQHRTMILEHAAYGNAAIAHFVNILLYGLTCLLLYRVLFLFFPTKKEENQAWFWSIPFVASLLFALHPIHTEVIANVKGRDEIMCLIGSLAAIYYAFKYIDTDKFLWAIVSALCLFLGLLGKENAITFVGVIPLSLYFFSKADFKKIGLATLPLLVAFVVWFIIRWQVLGFATTSGREVTDLMNNPFAEMQVGEKFATIFYTLGLYVKLLFFPHPLTHDYYPYHIPIMQWGNWQVLLSLLVYIVLGVAAFLGLRKKNVFAYAILFYLFTLSITSNLPFSVGTFMNERFVYISSIGLCIALAYLAVQKFSDWLGSPTGKYLCAGFLVVYMLGFGFKTIERVPAWKDAFALNSAAIKVSKNSARANTFMGTALFKEYQKETDRAKKETLINQVATHINKALSIHPNYGSALTMKSGVVAEQYKYHKDIDQLLEGFKEVLRIKINVPYIDTYMDYLNQGRAPTDKLVNWYYQVGTMMADEKGRRDFAAKFFRMGLEVAPNNPQLNAALQRVQ